MIAPYIRVHMRLTYYAFQLKKQKKKTTPVVTLQMPSIALRLHLYQIRRFSENASPSIYLNVGSAFWL